ncbi:MAG: OmpH family outer membrane protein [Chitinophagaceae bacterium]|nr:OmpH family outer membrane protein [Chitinophagaceae bacterium]
MKNISTYLSLLSLALIGVLFYLHFNTTEKKSHEVVRGDQKENASFKIAYFDIDSLQAKYDYFKDVSDKVKSKESSMTSQLNSLQQKYQKRMKELQDKAPTMTQSEGEAAQREYVQMQQKYQENQMSLEQDLKKHQIDMMTDVRNKIEDYLKKYNKDKGYAFILSYEPGFMLYYRDSLYDITSDVINGLNAEYKAKK